MADLKKHFQNPPKGGNERGVPTHNPMTPNPRPCGPTGTWGGGGANLEEQREKRLLSNASPEERMEYFQQKYNEPPPPATGPGAQTSLRSAFEAGEQTARENALHPSKANQSEFRNFDRGAAPAQTVADPSAYGAYDRERESSVENRAGRPPADPKPVPVLNPPTNTDDFRTDGKPLRKMK